nr:MAG TPA: hypothetical protein [Caudoviricetes sp.]
MSTSILVHFYINLLYFFVYFSVLLILFFHLF